MNDPKFHSNGGGAQGSQHPPHGPSWKHMHHSPFFWLAAVCLALGMIVYVVTSNLAFWPGNEAYEPVPALTP